MPAETPEVLDTPSPEIISTPVAKPERPAPDVARWIRDLFLSLIIASFFIMFLYQPVKVEGTSMLPVLRDQERIFINKFVYRFEDITPGDIIVFHYPYDPSKSYIKRVIAGPGDRVRIDDGDVYVNGERLHESYVPADFRDERSYPEIVVPAGKYFVLGDHRSLSNDSREFGPVGRKYIYGKAVFIYWPVQNAGVLH